MSSNTKAAADYAPGLPSKSDMGHADKLRVGQLLDYIVQKHNAERAGEHYPASMKAAADGGLSDILAGWTPPKENPYAGFEGFAGTFHPPTSNEQLAESLGRMSLTAAPAAALAGGLALWRPWESTPPKPVRRHPHRLKTAASLGEMAGAAYGQLPRIRLPDTLIGAGVGAAGGLGYDAVRSMIDKKPAGWRKHLGRVLTGAGVGALGANVVGDRARRYITNSFVPFGYGNDPGALRPKSLSHIWNAAILDKPQLEVTNPEGLKRLRDYGARPGYEPQGKEYNYRKDTLENYVLPARREIFRRQLGVHTNDPAKDIWAEGPNDQLSLNPKNPRSLATAQRFMGGLKAAPKELFSGDAWRYINDINKAGPDQSALFETGVVGGQQIPYLKRTGGGLEGSILDRWDYTLDPKEQAFFSQNKWNMLNPKWRNAPFNPKEELSGYFSKKNLPDNPTNAPVWGALASRWSLDNLVAYKHPWINQRFRIEPDPNLPENHSYFDPSHRIQLLTPEGATWGAPITSASNKEFIKHPFKEKQGAASCSSPPGYAAVKAAADYAPGLPSKSDMGHADKLRVGQMLDWIVQHHKAERAGEHYDVRFGNPEMGLLSWASRKGAPEPGQKHLAIQQPVHRHEYKDFEGEIPQGYGKGTVKTHEKGQVLLTKVTPNSIHFTTAHQRHPERFTLARPKGWGNKNWLLMNTSPRGSAGYEKLHYKSIPPEQVEPALAKMQDGTLEAKVDGASQLVRLAGGHAESLSYRTSRTTGRPISHTERFFQGRPEIKVPPALEGSVLKGELYAADPQGRAGTAQDVSTLLNSSLARSLELQKERGLTLRNMLYDVAQYGKKPIDPNVTSRDERRRMLEEIAAHLPADRFHVSEAAQGSEATTKLWNMIQAGAHPLTREGAILWPRQGPPVKAKIRPEHDVVLTGTYPGTGKRQATIGGFTWGHPHEPGKTVGRVGTGLSDALLSEVAKDPGAYIGRMARLQAHAKLPSGSLREPSFIGLHEDTNPDQGGRQIRAVGGDRAGTKQAAQLQLVDLPLYLRDGEGYSRFTAGQEGREGDTILRLSGSRTKAATAPDTWPVHDKGLDRLAEHDRPLYPQEQREVSGLWRPGDQSVRAMAEVRGVPGGYGPATSGPDYRAEKQRRSVLPGQLQVGDQERTREKPSGQPALDGRRPNVSRSGLGGAEQGSSHDHHVATGSGLLGPGRGVASLVSRTAIDKLAGFWVPDNPSVVASDFDPMMGRRWRKQPPSPKPLSWLKSLQQGLWGDSNAIIPDVARRLEEETEKTAEIPRGPEDEYCPHCDARQERGDDGRCNRCGKPWSEPRRSKKADAPRHVLVTGPSGAGKTTLARRLAAERNMPLARIDDSPSWKKFIENELLPSGVPDTHMKPAYQALRNRLAANMLRRKMPSIIEGSQLLPLDAQRVSGHELHLVAPPRDVVVAQRWNRLSTKPKNLHRVSDPSWKQEKDLLANTLYDEAEPDIARWRNFPGVNIKEGKVHPALADLKRAKAESDRRNYAAKHYILSQLLDKHPGEFVQDSAKGRMVGLTHPETGFKIHAPAQVVRGRALAPETMYHGSPYAFRTLRAGSWLTPYLQDARSFGVPWSSADLKDNDSESGRPPAQLRFKPGRVPNDAPLHVYRVNAPTRPAKTNTGREYDWNRQLLAKATAKRIESYPSWRDVHDKTAATAPLYHGSWYDDIKKLEPRSSRVLGGEKAVFATPDRDLAISFGAPWHDKDFEQGYVNNKPYMREQYRDAFKKIYGGQSGTLYTLPDRGFASDPRLMREERISRKAVKPEAAEHIPDMLAALRSTRFKLYPYKRRTKNAAAASQAVAGLGNLLRRLAQRATVPFRARTPYLAMESPNVGNMGHLFLTSRDVQNIEAARRALGGDESMGILHGRGGSPLSAFRGQGVPITQRLDNGAVRHGTGVTALVDVAPGRLTPEQIAAFHAMEARVAPDIGPRVAAQAMRSPSAQHRLTMSVPELAEELKQLGPLPGFKPFRDDPAVRRKIIGLGIGGTALAGGGIGTGAMMLGGGDDKSTASQPAVADPVVPEPDVSVPRATLERLRDLAHQGLDDIAAVQSKTPAVSAPDAPASEPAPAVPLMGPPAPAPFVGPPAPEPTPSVPEQTPSVLKPAPSISPPVPQGTQIPWKTLGAAGLGLGGFGALGYGLYRYRNRKKKDQIKQAGQAFTYVPTAVKDQVLREGLYSSKALLRRPDLFASIAKARGEDPEQWRSDIKERLKGWKPESSQGPSVLFHEPPDVAALPANHPMKRWPMSKINVDLDAILKHRPKSTRVHGLELEPYNEAAYDADPEGYPHKRHHDLTPAELGEIAGRSATDVWSKYKDIEGRGLYAGDVPHASIITRGGMIPPRYLKTAASPWDYVRTPLNVAGDVLGRVGNIIQGGAYGSAGTTLGTAMLPAQGAGRLGQALGIPGSSSLTSAADAFVGQARDAARAGVKDIGSQFAVTPAGHIDALDKANRALIKQTGGGAPMEWAHRGAGLTGWLSSQAIPSLLMGGGMGVAGRAAKALPMAEQVAPYVTPTANVVGNIAGKLGYTGNAAAPVQGGIRAAVTQVGKAMIPTRTPEAGQQALDAISSLGKPSVSASPMPAPSAVGMGAQRSAAPLAIPRAAPPARVNMPPVPSGSMLAGSPGGAGASSMSQPKEASYANQRQAVRAAQDGHVSILVRGRATRSGVVVKSAGFDDYLGDLRRIAATMPGRTGYKFASAYLAKQAAVPVTVVERSVGPKLWASLGGKPGQGTLTTDLTEQAMIDLVEQDLPEALFGKQADLIESDTQPYQRRIARRVAGGENLLVYHGLGSGKTRSAIMAAEEAGGPYAAVVPASLRGNFLGEAKKWAPGSNPEVLSYTGVGMGRQPRESPNTLIMDEVQRIRNPASAGSRAAMELAMRSPHRVLLSGTPIVNAPSDLAVPLSILTGDEMSPATFNKKFVGTKTVDPGLMGWFQGIQPAKVPSIKDEQGLERLLEHHVDYQPSRTPEGVKTRDERVEVDLSPEQQDFYKLMWGKLPWMTRWKLSNDYPLSGPELAHLSSFMTGPRQAALSLYPYHSSKDPMRAFQTSSKLQAAMSSLKETLATNPKAKALVYSNFIDAGLTPYGAALKAEGIPFGQFHGTMTEEERKQNLSDYNEGRSRVLLLGPAAAEGISAKGTQLIQLLDPHWNEARMGQARGRGLRFDSHEGLPEELRDVKIQRFVAKMPPPGWLGRLFGAKPRPSADEVLEQQSRRKEELNEQFRDVLRRVGSPGYKRPWSLFG